MDELVAWVQQQVSDNHFFQGGFVLMLLGTVAYWARSLPVAAYKWVKWFFIVTVSFDERSPIYDLFQAWLDEEKLMAPKRNVIIRVDDKADPPEIQVVPDRSSYWVKLRGVWCRLRKDLDRDSGSSSDGPDSSAGSTFRPPERYWISCFFWYKNRVLDTFRHIAQEYGITRNNQTPIYTCRWGWWSQRYTQPRRPIDHLIFKDGQLQEVLDDLQTFMDSRHWYEERQIPYQRGYMLTGPPGTGKTSLVAALADHFKLRLCILDMGSIDTDRELKEAFLGAPGRSIILVEDFDSFFDGRSIKTKSKVTFSGFLNAVNGVLSNPGRVLIMTTNKPGEVDPALTRIGRIDRTFHLGYLDKHQALGIIQRFFPGQQVTVPDDLSEWLVSPADLVGHLQKYRNEMSSALDMMLLLKEREERTRLEAEIDEQLSDNARILLERFKIDPLLCSYASIKDMVADDNALSKIEVAMNEIQASPEEASQALSRMYENDRKKLLDLLGCGVEPTESESAAMADAKEVAAN